MEMRLQCFLAKSSKSLFNERRSKRASIHCTMLQLKKWSSWKTSVRSTSHSDTSQSTRLLTKSMKASRRQRLPVDQWEASHLRKWKNLDLRDFLTLRIRGWHLPLKKRKCLLMLKLTTNILTAQLTSWINSKWWRSELLALAIEAREKSPGGARVDWLGTSPRPRHHGKSSRIIWQAWLAQLMTTLKVMTAMVFQVRPLISLITSWMWIQTPLLCRDSTRLSSYTGSKSPRRRSRRPLYKSKRQHPEETRSSFLIALNLKTKWRKVSTVNLSFVRRYSPRNSALLPFRCLALRGGITARKRSL